MTKAAIGNHAIAPRYRQYAARYIGTPEYWLAATRCLLNDATDENDAVVASPSGTRTTIVAEREHYAGIAKLVTEREFSSLQNDRTLLYNNLIRFVSCLSVT